MPEDGPLQVTGQSLSIEDVIAVARDGRRVVVAENARDRMATSRAVVERLVAENATAYGITTGFGDLANVRIEPTQADELQRNLVRSHAAGVGEALPEDVVRAMLLLRANTLAIGLSGVRPELTALLCEMLNARVHPTVPSRGSVGASGDLAPLAHLALVVIGEGEADTPAGRLPGATALEQAGLGPMQLRAKEGLALLNGTQLMAGVGALALHDALALAATADVVGAMSLEAMQGTAVAFDARLIEARPHAGQVASASHLRALLADSQIGAAHRDSPHRIQDPYSLRCMPQVHGAALDALGELGRVLAVEMNAVTDNPLVFPSGEVISGGNFHGEPLALALDYAVLAVTELAVISERRCARLVDAHLSGLPAFLSDNPGLESGLMIAQYTAAALVNELQTLAHPSSVDTIPTSANQEDHVSMGATSALRLRSVLELATTVLAIEALCAAQGLDFREPMRAGAGVAAAHAAIRERVAHLGADRPPSPDIELVRGLVAAGTLQAAADSARP
ncbi:MAG TPA: histidine ammonia-lyase [Candidatus Limnocylindria bacterium]|nr:histidine ammonia-lyase [Candidatus Limnocylindria bacterium]